MSRYRLIFRLGLGLCVGATVSVAAIAQGDKPPRQTTAPETAVVDGSRAESESVWRTEALALAGLAAVAFMHRRRRYD